MLDFIVAASCCIIQFDFKFLDKILKPTRPIPFVLAATNHGSMIVNRNDYCMVGASESYGVGHQLLSTSSYSPDEIEFALALLNLRKKYFGAGVVAIDGGANIGVHTIEWAKHMYGWGEVHAFEAQEKIYYALAGNIAINNCLNASAYFAALGAQCGKMKIPVPDYLVPSSFGSLELKRKTDEFIGQQIDYSEAAMRNVSLKSIDAFNWPRVDLVKIDVEGMEVDVLNGAEKTINRTNPVMIIEIVKTDEAQVDAFLTRHGYCTYSMGMNILAVHKTDKVNQDVKFSNLAVRQQL